MIAALYIDPRGPYPRLAGVDCWDEQRNAKLYAGPHPVVAHPPCGPWGALKHLSRAPVADCGPIAVDQVRRFGGVLEHPAGSALWAFCGLPRPGELPDRFGGFTISVDQCEWGHVARKRTWVYGVRVALSAEPPFPGRAPTHWVSGGRNPNRKGSGGLVPAGIKVCSAQQRRRTPPLFARWLVSLAEASLAR